MTVGPPSGTGWYRKIVTIDPNSVGKELYLDFGGAYQVTTLYIDGTQVDYSSNTSGTLDSHNGGFADFNFDVTSQLTAGSHLITVSVNNNTNGNISPAGAGDYTKPVADLLPGPHNVRLPERVQRRPHGRRSGASAAPARAAHDTDRPASGSSDEHAGITSIKAILDSD